MNTIPPIDIHVHIVGNGSSGSGCWIRLSGFNRFLARMMLRELRIPQAALTNNLDEEYVQCLLRYIRSSSFRQVVILAHERVYDESGNLLEGKGSMYVPNDYVLSLARQHPEFLPAVSIHPARPDALDELERTAALGAVMMKCLPNCQNIDCRNPRYKPFWKKMADLKMPLLAHTGGELSVQVIEKKYQDPEYLIAPLDCGVTTIAAHAATSSILIDTDYFPKFCEMTKQFPNLFGDISALNSPFRSKHLVDCLQPEIRDRIVHGSDLPIPISGWYAYLRGYLPGTELRKWNSIPNLLERDYQLKRGMGFSEEVFTRAWKLLRLSGRPDFLKDEKI